MATCDDVRGLALALPETEESSMWGSPAWKVRKRHFVRERPLRKGEACLCRAPRRVADAYLESSGDA